MEVLLFVCKKILRIRNYFLIIWCNLVHEKEVAFFDQCWSAFNFHSCNNGRRSWSIRLSIREREIFKVNNNVLSREFKHIVEIDFARERGREKKKIANIFTGAVWFSAIGEGGWFPSGEGKFPCIQGRKTREINGNRVNPCFEYGLKKYLVANTRGAKMNFFSSRFRSWIFLFFSKIE